MPRKKLDLTKDNIPILAGGKTLTYLEMIFVKEFLVDFSPIQAALRAGYTEYQAKKNTAEMLRRPQIRMAIAEALVSRTERLEITADMVVQEFAKIAFSNISDICEWDENGNVTFLASSEIPQAVLSAIGEVSVVPTENGPAIKIKLHSKMDALDKLAKHLGMYMNVHKHEHTGEGGGPIQYQELPAKKLADIAQHLLTLKERAADPATQN